MFASYVKMAAKAVALVAGVGIVLAFLTSFTLPNVNISFISDYMNKAYTIGVHYIPFFATLWTLGVTLLTLNLTIYSVKIALIAIKWVLKINEG